MLSTTWLSLFFSSTATSIADGAAVPNSAEKVQIAAAPVRLIFLKHAIWARMPH